MDKNPSAKAGTQVQSLVQEDPTHLGATKPQLLIPCSRACVLQQELFCCSVTKSCPILFDLLDSSMSGSPVLHYLPEFVQIHVH